jgi:RNA polymerase sigma-70 factor (ECF subfamily)
MEESRIYCVVPADLAGSLHELLRRHFSDRPEIDVVVESRGRERRSGSDRRAGATEGASPAADRRRIRSSDGRRVADRRAPLAPIAPGDAPELPRRARRHGDRLVFVERVAPSAEAAEDAEMARRVTRIQAGDRELFSELYLTYFDRIYGYMRVLLKDQHEAEDATQQTFAKAFERIGSYERRRQPFRAWLFVVARNTALDILKRSGRLDVLEPEEIGRHNERQNGEQRDPADTDALRWIADRDLSIFIERLPLAQRQVLLLRFMLDMTDGQIAAVLDRNPADVRMLQSRALRFLRKRLEALGRAPKRTQRARIRRSPRHATVLRSRRWALLP